MDRHLHVRFRNVWWVLCLLVALWPAVTAAQSGGDEGGEEKPPLEGHLAGEAGYEGLDEDGYLSLEAKFGLQAPVPTFGCEDGASECWTAFRLGMGVPLRLRVVDRAPGQSSMLRRADWDEASDFVKVLRFAEYGSPSEALYGRVGELGQAVLGHGTIVDRYFNVVTPDHYELGARVTTNTVWGGGTVMVDDVVGPSVVAMRGYVRPWGFVDPEAWAHRIAVGVSVVSDVNAPYGLARKPDGSPVVGPARRPRVAERRGTVVGGLDLEVTAVDTQTVTLAPYVDGNTHFKLGSGLHAGLSGSVRPVEDLELSWRMEYRLLGEGYLPGYVGSLYEIDRFQYEGWGTELPAPKLRVAASRTGGHVHGGYGRVTAEVFDWGEFAVGMAEHEGDDNASVHAQMRLTPVERFQLGAYYYKQNFDAIAEVFERDGALFVGETRVRIWGPLYAKAAYQMLWQLRDDGIYEPVDRWSVGLGASMKFGGKDEE